MTDGKDVRAVLYKRIGISLLAVAIAVSLTACGFLSIPSAVQELLSSGRRFPPLRRRLSMPGTMPEKRRLPPKKSTAANPGQRSPLPRIRKTKIKRMGNLSPFSGRRTAIWAGRTGNCSTQPTRICACWKTSGAWGSMRNSPRMERREERCSPTSPPLPCTPC